MELAVYGYAFAAVLYTAFTVALAYRPLRKRDASFKAFAAAVAATAAWAWAWLAAHRGVPLFDIVATALDPLRYGFWFLCLLGLLRPPGAGWRSANRGPMLLAAVLVAAELAVLSLLAMGFTGSAAVRGSLFLALALPVFGLFLVEQFYRNLDDDSRWSFKPFCLGLGLLFAFDIYLYSEAVLFGRFDVDSLSVRGAVHGMAVPFLLIGWKRQARSIPRLRLSRAAAFHSATLLLVGVYLLLISGMGYYVRRFGGEWGSALQLGLLIAAAIVLATALVSGAMRAKLRVFVGKHFFRYRYDYRTEWLRFTAMLAQKTSPQEMGVSVVHGLADLVESPGGALWYRGLGDGEFVQTARWNMVRIPDMEPVNSDFATFLLKRGWIVDIRECAAFPQRYESLSLPPWLLAAPEGWLVVPLLVADSLVGFVVLARPRTPVEVNWEVRDLLKTASRQAAGFLAQMHATEALLEARKFDAFNRMSAFVVHDLKNIVTQLSLMMKNAKRLQSNPEFQKDMLATVENSLEKMRQLMLQLRGGDKPAGGTSGVDLAAIGQRLQAVAAERGRALELEIVDRVTARGHDERVERVLGHVVQNAFDATPASGRVWLRLERASGQARVVVGDTGRGMSQEFIHTRLFKPFSSTKEGGMGIGAYESFQYVRELGGSVDVESELDVGTKVTISLPLFDAPQKSDLQLVSAK
jgi:putative PEP-CTERM system histidine kinase